jgi:transcriptional regulator with XRE-family HTH domain
VTLRTTLVKRLRALRAERGLSQMALAERAGIGRSYLARLELGQQDPTLATLEKLARALGVKVSRLIE